MADIKPDAGTKSMFMKCPECGTQNRIPDSPEPGRRYLCGNCKAGITAIPPIAETKKQRAPGPQIAIDKQERKPTALGDFLRKLSWVHPMLFALFPVLYLYSMNLAEVTPSRIIVPLFASLGFGVFMFLFFLLIFALIQKVRMRSTIQPRAEIWVFGKAAIITSIFLILFFNYSDALAIFRSEWYVLAAVWILLFLIAAFLVVRTRRALGNVTSFLAVSGAILVVIFSMDIVYHEMRFGGRVIETAGHTGNGTTMLTDSESRPDIYYIIPDRYGSENSLQKNFQFDNSEFIDYLMDKGFYVARDSHSNYSRTFASLASSLNMEYINYLTDELGEDFRANYPMWQLLMVS